MIFINDEIAPIIAIIKDSGIILTDAQSALDLMATVRHEYDCDRILIDKSNICDDFFDLKTGIAGEILQKYSNYMVKLAIVGDFSNIESKSLRDFIYECNSGNQVFFVVTEKEGADRLRGAK